MTKPAYLLCLVALGAVITGCGQPCPETFVPREQLVAEFNANASQVTQLWARADITVKLPGQLPINIEGLMLLGKPDTPGGQTDFVLQGKNASVPVFQLGSSADQGVYYFWYRYGDQASAVWGRNEFAGAPGIEALPVDPNDLLSVLSICELPEDFTTLPTVTMSMQTARGKCAYILSFIDRQAVSGSLISTRQILFDWSDTKPRRPFAVNFYDANGMEVLKAKLSGYEQIDTGSGDADSPIMPTDISIDWPGRKSSLRIRLSEMTTSPTGDPAMAARFDPPVPAEKVIQIDRHLDTGSKPQ